MGLLEERPAFIERLDRAGVISQPRKLYPDMNLEKTIKELESADREVAVAKAERNQLLRVIGKELRQMREEKHLKGVTVAKAIKMGQAHLFFIEHGTAKMTVDRLKKIHAVITKLEPAKAKNRWDKVDWRKSTSQIAKELGVSFEAARMARKKYDR